MKIKADSMQKKETADVANSASSRSHFLWLGAARNTSAFPRTHETQPAFSSPVLAMPTPEVADRIRQQPECRLLWAILQDALETYVKHCNGSTRRAKRLFIEAEEWMMQDDVTWVCSFVNICHVLAIDPDYIRMGLKRWRLNVQPSDSRAAA